MRIESGPKLLDFGLAKWKPVRQATSSSMLPTQADLSTPGAVLGTLQYMAPEQLEGSEADARTDIFAFGSLLHEMVTGKKAFEGKSQVLLVSAIATSHPAPLSAAEPATPPALDHIVKTCMSKDPADRWQTARAGQEPKPCFLSQTCRRPLCRGRRTASASFFGCGIPRTAAIFGCLRSTTKKRRR
jgi:serine/threonine protein kinase